MLDKTIPELLKENCLERIPPNKRVWGLKIQVSTMLISTLDWQFDIPFWQHENKKYAITPNQVINDPKRYDDHYNRILQSHLEYPMEIVKNQTNKWEILDGLHRLVKAKILGFKKVKVRKISKTQFKRLLKEL